MIYLQRDVQQDAVALFHYALNPDGYLVLGKSETIDRGELFACEDKGTCYRKRNVPTREANLPMLPAVSGSPRPATEGWLLSSAGS